MAGSEAEEEAEARIQAVEEVWLNQTVAMRRYTTKKAPLKRLHTRRWVVEVDSQLQFRPFEVGGLKRYQAPDNWREILDEGCLDWPCLVLSADEGRGLGH